MATSRPWPRRFAEQGPNVVVLAFKDPIARELRIAADRTIYLPDPSPRWHVIPPLGGAGPPAT
jgi:hypothetical protein